MPQLPARWDSSAATTKPGCGPLFPLLRQQRLAGVFEIAQRRATQGWKLQAEAFQRFDQHRRHDNAAEPLVVGGDDVPGGFWCAGVTDRVLVGGHVSVPKFALRKIANLELPMLGGRIETLEE